MSKQAWGEMVRACNLKSLKGFMQHFMENANTDYLDLYEIPDPQEFKWPEAADKILSDFTKLIVIRIIKPDKLVPALVSYVVSKIGEEFVQPPPFDLAAIYKDSTNITPLIFVLSPGSDPMKALESIATAKKRVLKAVSLGKG
jgi:dynein heavy chain